MRYVLLALAVMAAPAAAQERELCPARPGLGTPACVVAPGRMQIETSLVDWTVDKGMQSRSDRILLADTLARVGVSDELEVQIGWTPIGYTRERTGTAADRAIRSGDITLGAKLNLANPDGKGFSLAIQPRATLPVGRAPIGAGDWSASLIVPLSFDLSDAVQLQLSPEMDAAVDVGGHGRHLAYGATAGLDFELSDAVEAALELKAIRDRDPMGHATEAYGGLSIAWRRTANLQLDVGANLGLNHDSDDIELYAGVTRRF